MVIAPRWGSTVRTETTESVARSVVGEADRPSDSGGELAACQILDSHKQELSGRVRERSIDPCQGRKLGLGLI